MKSEEKSFKQQRMMRTENRFIVLKCIADGLRTRRQIQAETGLSWGTVSNCVAELESEGVIVLKQRPCNDRFLILPEQNHGANSFCVFSEKSNILGGIHITNTRLDLRFFTPDHKVLYSDSEEISPPQSIVELKEMLEKLLKKSRFRELAAYLCISLTGAFDRDKLLWLKTTHLPAVNCWELSSLKTLIPGEVVFEHDIVSKARSVSMNQFCGDDFAFFHIGDGIGLTMCRDGIFQEGVRGFAGEIGHLPYPGSGECLENIASMRGLQKISQQNGCSIASPECWNRIKPYWAWCGVAAVNMFDPSVLLIGGEAPDLFQNQLDELVSMIRQNAWQNGPEKIIFYRMSECDTASGAAFSLRTRLLKKIASGSSGINKKAAGY